MPQQLQGFRLVRLKYVNTQRLKRDFKALRLYSNAWHFDFILAFFMFFVYVCVLHSLRWSGKLDDGVVWIQGLMF